MNRKLRIYCIPVMCFVAAQVAICAPVSENSDKVSVSSMVQQIHKSYLNEKRASPAYDKIIGEDGMNHYRVLFWVPKSSTKFVAYADDGVKTNVSSHGPVEKWCVQETKITNGSEKLVYILVPKTFVYLYGEGFEEVIHLKYS